MWRLGVLDPSEAASAFVISQRDCAQAVIFEPKGVVECRGGERASLWSRRAQHTNVVAATAYLEFASVWRLGVCDDGVHLALCHRDEIRPSAVWSASEGPLHAGTSEVRTELHLWPDGGQAGAGAVLYGEGFLQIGGWRLAMGDSHHLCVMCTRR